MTQSEIPDLSVSQGYEERGMHIGAGWDFIGSDINFKYAGRLAFDLSEYHILLSRVDNSQLVLEDHSINHRKYPPSLHNLCDIEVARDAVADIILAERRRAPTPQIPGQQELPLA